MAIDFIHLRLHTEYSLVDGIVKIKPLVKHLVEMNMPAVAITEQSNLFSLVKFYNVATAQGIKPIVGSDVFIFNPTEPAAPFRMTLLVQNNSGYNALTKLISMGYQQGQHQGVPMLQREWVEQHNNGLIALSGAQQGDAGRSIVADNLPQATRYLKGWAACFKDRYYLELQRVGKPHEKIYIEQAVSLAEEIDLPVVATNDVRFLKQDDFASHEARVCINQGRILGDPRRPKDYTRLQYLKSPEEMVELFSDLPEALENTVEIAKRCNLELTFGQSYLPDFAVPQGMTLNDYFRTESKSGLEERLKLHPPVGQGTIEENLKRYWERLAIELDVIIQMGFPGYFMIVADFIQWAKKQDIPVGPGRGSGAGSIVAYALNITDLDPLEFNLLFERFLNPERVSMPDFDIDFCMDRRDEVIDYVANKYGRDHVSQIITFGSMAAKAVVRDVGRVMGHGYGFVDKLAKLIPFELGITLQKALEDAEELRQLYDTDEEVKNLIDMALSLEGVARNAGKHAGGVVISPSPLTDFSPLFCEQGGGNLVTQFDKDDVESVGLVKFDFLGLRTLTIIDWALKTINEQRALTAEEPIDIDRIHREDPKTYELLKKSATTAVFQLESRGIKELIRKMQPDCFEDIIALVALFRPGPLESGMVDDYVNVKHGRAKAEYAHPLLEPILKSTNGVILYQEQVMQIALEMAGYTLGSADLLRRAMGKKKPEEMAKQRVQFTEGAVSKGVEESVATYIFNLMEKFAGYGFNKSHSAAYALVAYQTAWLKTHFPAAFMAAVLSSDMDNTDKVVMLIEECRSMGLTIDPPNINLSNLKFTVVGEQTIFYGLAAIKGVGQSAIDEILQQRKSDGVFADVFDLCQRVDLRKVNRRVLEALIRAGSFDVFGINRAAHISILAIALKTAEQRSKMTLSGQDDLFGLDNGPNGTEQSENYIKTVEPWTENERLMAEKQTLGLYLTGHPIKQYEVELAHFTHGKIRALMEKAERSRAKMTARLAGLMVDLRTRQTKKGKTMAYMTVDDQSARIEIVILPAVYEEYRDNLSKDMLIIAEGELKMSDFSGAAQLTAEKLFSIEQARTSFARCLVVNWHQSDTSHAEEDFLHRLQGILQPFCGQGCPIIIDYDSGVAKATLQLGDEWRVHPSDELLDRLQKFSKALNVNVKYR